MLSPRDNDPIEMREDDLAYLASQTRREVVFKLLGDIKAVGIQPELACYTLPQD